MLGPLPRLHRLLTAAVVLLSAVLAGAYAGFEPQVPVTVPTGAAAGALGGLLLTWLFLHPARRLYPGRVRS